MAESNLYDELQTIRIDVNRAHWKAFIPRSDIKRLITREVIGETVRRKHRDIRHDEALIKQYAEDGQHYAKGLFAILIWIHKAGAIRSFLDEGIIDAELPLLSYQEEGRTRLRTKQNKHIAVFESWRPQQMIEFDRMQWEVKAPVFKLDDECLELPDQTVLPFIPLRDDESQKNPHSMIGGYSEVTAHRIHPAHHNFWKLDNPSVYAIISDY